MGNSHNKDKTKVSYEKISINGDHPKKMDSISSSSLFKPAQTEVQWPVRQPIQSSTSSTDQPTLDQSPRTQSPRVEHSVKSKTSWITDIFTPKKEHKTEKKSTDRDTDIKTSNNPIEKVIMNISTEIKTPNGYKKLLIKIDHDEYVRLFMDPTTDLRMPDMSYLIGYKMVYVVDEYRQRIPNVIAIVTLKINSHKNAIFQSEKSAGHKMKDHYDMLKLSSSTDRFNFYTRDQQADSLKHKNPNGNMIAWEHSTKYCAHNVETLALTFCGKFKDVIKACQKYDNNMAFAESAYTYEENQDPVIYEVGCINYSKHERPVVASGKCLDFFHFFLRPEYAIDYGFWQFQFSEKRTDVNQMDIVLGKKFSNARKVSYTDCYANSEKLQRNSVTLIKSEKGRGFMSSQIIIDKKQNDVINCDLDAKVDEMFNELEFEMQNTSTHIKPKNDLIIVESFNDDWFDEKAIESTIVEQSIEPIIVEPIIVEESTNVEPVIVEPIIEQVIVEPIVIESAVESITVEPIVVEPIVVEPIIVEPIIESTVEATTEMTNVSLEDQSIVIPTIESTTEMTNVSLRDESTIAEQSIC